MAANNPFPPGVGDFKDPTDDNARYVVPLSMWQRPRFYAIGAGEFEWPVGTEDFRLQGGATLAEHKYVSDNAAVIQVTHREAALIEMTGTFPGKTGPANMRALRQMCVAVDPPDGKRLELPGIFTQAQKVVADNWEFTSIRPEDAWGVAYTVTFRIVGVAAATHKTPPTPKPPTGPKGNLKGQTVSAYKVNRGNETLRTAAFQIWGDPDRWKDLYSLNQAELNNMYPDALISSMPTKVLPLGTPLKFASK